MRNIYVYIDRYTSKGQYIFIYGNDWILPITLHLPTWDSTTRLSTNTIPDLPKAWYPVDRKHRSLFYNTVPRSMRSVHKIQFCPIQSASDRCFIACDLQCIWATNQLKRMRHCFINNRLTSICQKWTGADKIGLCEQILRWVGNAGTLSKKIRKIYKEKLLVDSQGCATLETHYLFKLQKPELVSKTENWSQSGSLFSAFHAN